MVQTNDCILFIIILTQGHLVDVAPCVGTVGQGGAFANSGWAMHDLLDCRPSCVFKFTALQMTVFPSSVHVDRAQSMNMLSKPTVFGIYSRFLFFVPP